MRKFIISDIHGFGNLYYSIINYLDDISKSEDIELYINGDLFDRGYESGEILLDVIKRIKDNKYKIVYLGGNHEFLMYEAFEKRKKQIFSYDNDWYYNGGYITDNNLDEILDDKEKILEVVDFVSELPIYHKFEEKINNKNIVLVHAANPRKVKDECQIKIKNKDKAFYYVWTRENDPYVPFKCKVSHEDYFTIIGHTPNENICGYEYNKKNNYLNIDGGAAMYVTGLFEYDHFPLVEVFDGYLKILTFNGNNEIVYGSYFDGEKSIPLSDDELENERKHLNKNIKINKLALNEDGIVYYGNEKKHTKSK